MKKMTVTRMISAVLAAAFAASAVASCSSSKREEKVVQAGDTWYDCEAVDLQIPFSQEDYPDIEYEIIGSRDDSVYVWYESCRDEADAVSYEQAICRYSFNGDLIDTSIVSEGTADASSQLRYVSKVWISDGDVHLFECEYDEQADLETYYLDGEVFTVPDISSVDPWFGNGSITDIITSDGYTLLLMSSRFGSEEPVIVAPDGTFTMVDIYSRFAGGISQFGELQTAEDGTAVFDVWLSGYELASVSLNLRTGELTELESVFENGMYIVEYAGDKMIRRGYDGLWLLDPASGEATKLFEYCDVDIPFLDILETQSLYLSDDLCEMVLARDIGGTGYGGSMSGLSILHLSKAADNPNAGKKLIVASCAEEDLPDNSECYAVNLFNRSNDSYFIKFVLSMDEYGNYVDNRADIIFDEYPEAGPSDSVTCLDLSPYMTVENGFDEGDYFTGAIEAARMDGGLYRMPVDISVRGIVTASVNVPQGQVGFTFDQYETFVDEVCNGIDPMSSTPNFKMGKPQYFTTLFLNMSDRFMGGGHIDLSGEDIIALLEFVDRNGSEVSMDTEEIVGEHNAQIEAVVQSIEDHNAGINGTHGAVYSDFYSFADYMECYTEYGEGLGVYGIPSFDGRGPQTVSHDFVSVSADTLYPDVCASFVRLLLSYEVQSTMRYVNPINIQATCDLAAAYIEEYNSMDERTRGNEFFLRDPSQLPAQIPLDAAGRFVQLLSSSYGGISAGSKIEEILLEESSAYFSGSMAAQDVIPVMQDRIQTVLSENG